LRCSRLHNRESQNCGAIFCIKAAIVSPGSGLLADERGSGTPVHLAAHFNREGYPLEQESDASQEQ
jgi:hypothetical protein